MKTIDDRHHPEHPDAARRLAETIGKIIDSKLPKGKWGFALLIFNFGPGGTIGYMSNSRREDMIKTLRELADNMEGKKDV